MKRQRESVRDGKKGKLKVKRRSGESATDGNAKKDRLSDLPNEVLIHIMEFMKPKEAVQTCVLSKRWKNLWKRLDTLKLDSADSSFNRSCIFDKFVSRILSYRDGSVPLHKLVFVRYDDYTRTTLLNRLIRYVASHSVQQLIISVVLSLKHEIELPPSIFNCKSLTFLNLSIKCHPTQGTDWHNVIVGVKVPKSLELPALKSLILEGVTFSTSDKGYVEPFSTCTMLNTLVINHCYLQKDSKTLYITNSKLSILTIGRTSKNFVNKVELATPKLTSFTSEGSSIHELSSSSNLPFLEGVNIDITNPNLDFPKKALVLISWLQVLANVKTMTLCSNSFEILNVLSNSGPMKTQPPHFPRLKLLNVKVHLYPKIYDEEIIRIIKYLLQNSPSVRVDVKKLFIWTMECLGTLFGLRGIQ